MTITSLKFSNCNHTFCLKHTPVCFVVMLFCFFHPTNWQIQLMIHHFPDALHYRHTSEARRRHKKETIWQRHVRFTVGNLLSLILFNKVPQISGKTASLWTMIDRCMSYICFFLNLAHFLHGYLPPFPQTTAEIQTVYKRDNILRLLPKQPAQRFKLKPVLCLSCLWPQS